MKQKNISILLLVITVVIIAQAFTMISQPSWKNLKVLPQNITHDSLDGLMDEYKYALTVRCNYCHAASKENPRRMDMASEDNPKKEIARNMIRMTNQINQQFITLIPHADTTKLQIVTCNTCHRGKAKPDMK